MKILTSPIGLNAMGAGPKIFRPVFPFLLAGIITAIFFPGISHLPFHQTLVVKNFGYTWLSVGILFYLAALIQFFREFPKGKLITSGVYRLSRNPIYASWIVFILPGLSFTANNWIFFLSSLVMYISLQMNIREEEIALMKTFGERYNTYRKQVERVFFVPGLRFFMGPN